MSLPFDLASIHPWLEAREDQSDQAEIVCVTMSPRMHCTHDDQEADLKLASLWVVQRIHANKTERV